MNRRVPRENAGAVLLALSEQPKGSVVNGLMLNLTDGDKNIVVAVATAADHG